MSINIFFILFYFINFFILFNFILMPNLIIQKVVIKLSINFNNENICYKAYDILFI